MTEARHQDYVKLLRLGSRSYLFHTGSGELVNVPGAVTLAFESGCAVVIFNSSQQASAACSKHIESTSVWANDVFKFAVFNVTRDGRPQQYVVLGSLNCPLPARLSSGTSSMLVDIYMVRLLFLVCGFSIDFTTSGNTCPCLA